MDDLVYQPDEDSFLMLDALQKINIEEGMPALDMGTGSGILSVEMAKRGAKVTAVDINPYALEATRQLAERIGVPVTLVHSNLFENVRGSYDLIVFNPPYVPTPDEEPHDLESIAWHGGRTGLSVILPFLSSAPRFLNPSGRILLLVSSRTESPPAFPGFSMCLLEKKSFFFERLFVLEMRPLPSPTHRNASL